MNRNNESTDLLTKMEPIKHIIVHDFPKQNRLIAVFRAACYNGWSPLWQNIRHFATVYDFQQCMTFRQCVNFLFTELNILSIEELGVIKTFQNSVGDKKKKGKPIL